MSCAESRNQLFAFHFGDVPEPTRQALEGHLAACPACLREYLALKREAETAESEPRASQASRVRLRAAVAEELGVGARPWRWWERPLAAGLATVALAIALVVIHIAATSSGGQPHALSEENHSQAR